MFANHVTHQIGIELFPHSTAVISQDSDQNRTLHVVASVQEVFVTLSRRTHHEKLLYTW